MKWKNEEIAMLQAEFCLYGANPIAIKLGRTPRAVMVKASKMGFTSVESGQKRRSNVLKSRNISVDMHYFERPVSQNLAYLVGYIFGDGTIGKRSSTLQLCCATYDEELILNARAELKSSHKVTKTSAKKTARRNNKAKTSCQICSKVLIESLENLYGVVERKSSKNIPFPERITGKYVGDFARGLLDSDGNVHKTRGNVSFCGSYSYLKGLKDRFIDILGVKDAKMYRQKKIWSMAWYAYEDRLKIYNFLYPKGEYLFGKRKKILFEQQLKLS